MSAVKLSVMTTDLALREWAILEGLLVKSVPYSSRRVGPDYWHRMVETKQGMVLIAWDPEARHLYAAFYCEKFEHPSGIRVFSICACGGSEIAEWAHLWSEFERIARGFGCHQLEIVGRRGWKRFIDAEEAATIFVKELGNVTAA